VGQGFALLATCVGLFTIAVGVGPRTVPDVAYHVAIVIVLLWGLMVARRART
jgi:branched-subunit amino acid permease